MSGIKREVDENVGPLGADALGGGFVGEAAQVDERVRGGGDVATHRVAVVGAERKRHGANLRGVVRGEDVGDEVGDRVVAIVGREIADHQRMFAGGNLGGRQRYDAAAVERGTVFRDPPQFVGGEGEIQRRMQRDHKLTRARRLAQGRVHAG